MTFIAYYFGKNARRMILILVVLILAILFRPSFITGRITFSCLINMLPLFTAGCLLRKNDLRMWENRMIGFGCLAVFTLVALFEGDVNLNGMSFYVADSTWNSLLNVSGSVTFFGRPIVGFVGSIGIMALMKLILDVFPSVTIVSKVGTMTLGIYLFHSEFVGMLKRYTPLAYDLFMAFVVTVILIAVSLIITYALTNWTGKFKFLIWGK